MLPVCAILLAIAAVFWPVCSFQFTGYDDPGNVAANPDLNPVTAASLAKYWAGPYMDMYIPVAYTTWAALATLAQTPDHHLDPTIFHTANLLLHAAASLVVYAILRRLLDKSSDWAACAGALLFAIHPLQVEPVAWVSGLRDVLGGLLALTSAWCYLTFATAGKRKGWALAAGLLAFVLSILSKPSAMSLPVALAAIDWLVLRRDAKRVLPAISGWVLVAVATAVLTKFVQPAGSITPVSLWARPIVALDALAFYTGKLIAPLSLGIDYGRTPQWLLSNAAAWWTWVVPVVGGTVVWLNRRRWPVVAAGAAVFAAMLLPVLGLVSFEFQRHSTVADRYAYLAMPGAAMVLAAVVRRWPTRATAAVVGGLLLLYGVRSYAQVWTWEDSKSLYGHAVEVNPTSLAGNDWLGLDAAQHGDFPAAMRYLQTALAAHPDDPVTNYYVGSLLLYAGHPAEAVGPLRIGLRGRTEWNMYHELSIAMARSGDIDGALAVAREGLQRWPDRAELHRQAGDMLAVRRDWPAATAEFETAQRLNPHLPGLRERLAEVARRAASQPTTRP